MKKYIIFLFLIIITFQASSQGNQRFRHITINDGLAHTDGTCVIQDKTGFMWFGTNAGLQRFDGIRLKLFMNNTNPIRRVYNNRITSLYNDNGLLWVGSEGGLHCFSIREEKFLPLKIANPEIDLSGTVISKIIILKEKIVLITNQKIYAGTFNPETVELNLISLNQLLTKPVGSNLTYYDAATDLQDKIWIATNTGLIALIYEKEKFSFLEKVNGDSEKFQLSASAITQVEYFDNQLLITAIEDLEIISLSRNDHKFKSLLKTFHLKKYFKGMDLGNENLAITKIISDHNDNFWAATAIGLIFIENPLSDEPSVHIFSHNQFDKYSISAEHCADLYLDNSNCLWIGTWGGGISYLDLEQKQFGILRHNPLEKSTSLSGEFVRAISEGPNGEIWVGTRNEGINLLDPKTGQCTFLKLGNITNESLSNNKIRSLKYKNQKMYVGTTNGLNIIDLKTNTINKIAQNSGYTKNNMNSAIFEIVIDKRDQIWLATWGGGIGRIRFENGQPVTSNISTQSSGKNKLSSDIVNAIYYDQKKDEIWATTSLGINRILLTRSGDISKVIYYQSNNSSSSISSDYIWPIIQANDSTFWIGTLGGGLNKLTIGSKIDEMNLGSYHSTVYDTEKGCPANDVETMLMDDQGKLWIGGKGLSRFDPDVNEFWNFDVNDGLQSNGFKIGAAFKSTNGTLYFGGINGLNYFVPSEIKKNKTKPQVAFTSFRVFNQEVEPNQIIHKRILLKNGINYLNQVLLKYNENDFSIGFASLHYANPEKCKFKYLLEGYDENWKYIDSKYPFANYSNLSYGEYTFLVDASNNDGIWSGTPVSLKVKITPPWWQSNIALIGYILLTIGLIYGSYFYSIRWIKMKNDLKLKEADEKRKDELLQTKLQFFTNISHEFKTPLTLIISPLEKLKSDEISNSEKHKFLDLITVNAGRLLSLINELIEFRKAESGKLTLHSQKAELFQLLNQIGMQFQDIARQKDISLKIINGSGKPIWFDQEKMTKIIYNLISNSVKFTNEGGEIELEVFTSAKENLKSEFAIHVEFDSGYNASEYTFIRVKDNGIGITPGSINQIFDRFFHLNDGGNQHLGSGIGLALVKSLVMLHQGFIQVSSERYKGTEIMVGFPLGDAHVRPEEKLAPEESSSISASDILDPDLDFKKENLPKETITTTENLPGLLIVEDNDELRNMLIEHYSNEFKVFGAKNGVEGIRTATNEFPELIISDIMMPEMDGVEMCKTLKEDIQTSHIPIILLTAKSSIEHQIEGTEAGADVYIPKPFSLRLLDAQIKRLIESQSSLKEKYASDIYASTREIVKNRKDQEFLDSLINIINENIDNNDFNVNILCQELGFGRTNLYKKIKSVTGYSLGEFIRSLRLKKAAKLLVSQDISISEVIFMVGINSNSYFTKAFKAQFGVTPSEFINQQRKNEKKGNEKD